MKVLKKSEKSDWINYLNQQQNMQEFKLYNEVISTFTIIIAVLTGINIVISIGIIPLKEIQFEIWIWIVVILIIVGVTSGVIYYLIHRLLRAKFRLFYEVHKEAILTGDILLDNIPTTQEAVKRFINTQSEVKGLDYNKLRDYYRENH